MTTSADLRKEIIDLKQRIQEIETILEDRDRWYWVSVKVSYLGSTIFSNCVDQVMEVDTSNKDARRVTLLCNVKEGKETELSRYSTSMTKHEWR